MAVRFFSSAIPVVAVLLLLGCGATAFQAAHVPRPAVRGLATCLDAVSRRDALASAASAALVILSPLDALAADASPTSYQGVFRDPKHPKGYRVLIGDSKAGKMTLQDDPDGKVYNIPFKVKTEKPTGQVTLTLDFSVKGGPKDVPGTLGKGSSISFPDGNVWKKEDGLIGVYSDGLNPKFRRVIRKKKGSELAVELINGGKTVNVVAKAGSPDVTFDFPGKPGDKGTVDNKKGTISFADGNVWTKL